MCLRTEPLSRLIGIRWLALRAALQTDGGSTRAPTPSPHCRGKLHFYQRGKRKVLPSPSHPLRSQAPVKIKCFWIAKVGQKPDCHKQGQKNAPYMLTLVYLRVSGIGIINRIAHALRKAFFIFRPRALWWSNRITLC